MRADRLLSLILILQSRGKVRAADLARELEVSVRTIHRFAASSHSVPHQEPSFHQSFDSGFSPVGLDVTSEP